MPKLRQSSRKEERRREKHITQTFHHHDRASHRDTNDTPTSQPEAVSEDAREQVVRYDGLAGGSLCLLFRVGLVPLRVTQPESHQFFAVLLIEGLALGEVPQLCLLIPHCSPSSARGED